MAEAFPSSGGKKLAPGALGRARPAHTGPAAAGSSLAFGEALLGQLCSSREWRPRAQGLLWCAGARCTLQSVSNWVPPYHNGTVAA